MLPFKQASKDLAQRNTGLGLHPGKSYFLLGKSLQIAGWGWEAAHQKGNEARPVWLNS